MGTERARVVFLGNDSWSVPALEALSASPHDVVLVVTRDPRPARRGGGLVPTPVAGAAGDLSLPLLETGTAASGEGFDRVAASEGDILAVVAYGEILPQGVLDLPETGTVNLHFSLLPKLRGAAPVQRALLEGLGTTGTTTILMDRGMDTGPILLQREEAVLPDDDAGSLGSRLAEAGAAMLVETIGLLMAGELRPRPQDHEAATLAPKLEREDRWLDWSEDAPALSRRVRALAPDPAASTRLRGAVLKVFRAEAAPGRGSPGEVLSVGGDGFVVAAGRGGLRPLEVAPAGRRRMAAGDFVRGARLRPGERLG